MRYIYPGDYERRDEKECSYCLNHSLGIPARQWKTLDHRNDLQYEDLKNKIQRNGVIEPVTINIDKHKVIEDGHHRVFAAHEIGLKYIPSKIYGKLTIPERFLC